MSSSSTSSSICCSHDSLHSFLRDFSADRDLHFQDFDHIRQRCLEDEKLFVDPHFPPCPQSLYLRGGGGRDVEWMRASEICDDPQLFVGGATRFDINQGELGDCWLLAAIANLTLHKKLFHQVVPLDQSFTTDYAGIFHFR